MTVDAQANGVRYDLQVSPQGSPDMTVQVAAGAIIFDNVPVTVAAVSALAIGAADTSTAATMTTALTGANNDLLYTAATAGDDGNHITVEYRDPAAASQSLSVDVQGTTILVMLATDGGSVITSTASSIDSAIAGNTDADALVAVTNAPANSGAGVVTAMDPTSLTGGLTVTGRYDLVTVDNTGTVAVLAGTAANNPVVPSTTTEIVLASIYIGVGQTTVTSDDIADARPLIPDPISPYQVTGLWYGPLSTGGSVAGWTDQDMFLVPFFTGKSIALQSIGFRTVVPTATAGSKARLGIYRDDGAGGRTLLVDAGQVAADGGNATPSASIAVTLTPGWWWLALAFQSLGATKPTILYLQLTGLNTPLGSATITDASNGRRGYIRFTGISGALPSVPTSPDYTASTGTCPALWVRAT